eukprot:Blabericola_migrator_1__2775@NODE_1793_length_3785_cov_72_793168_g1157_i0_p1_GENE_NODE_1793_length_3785_cov_72_793168_g1157_i0NODE_1793_length_3785_cov_72_793168_g1157_i0_p1_ORF_typecomplete_len381_score52_76_NODE_1793_length_3785_cov_72_793168_g1157_i02211363
MASIRFARQFQRNAKWGARTTRSIEVCSVLLPLSAILKAGAGDVTAETSQSPEADDVATSSNAAPGLETSDVATSSNAASGGETAGPETSDVATSSNAASGGETAGPESSDVATSSNAASGGETAGPETSDVATSSNAAPGGETAAPEVKITVTSEIGHLAVQRWTKLFEKEGIRPLEPESFRLLNVLSGDTVIESTIKMVEEALRSAAADEMEQNLSFNSVSTPPPHIDLIAKYGIVDSNLVPSQVETDATTSKALKIAASHVLNATLNTCVRIKRKGDYPCYSPSISFQSPTTEEIRALRWAFTRTASLYRKPLVHDFLRCARVKLRQIQELPRINLTRLQVAAVMEERLSKKVVIEILDDIVSGDKDKLEEWNRNLG